MLGVLLALPGLAFTYEYEGQTLNYEILDEDAKTCYVGENKVSGNLVIPTVAKDGDTEYTVIQIGDMCFWSNDELLTVVIPESVTSIGSEAFASCMSLTSATIPESVTSIGESAFRACISLTSVTIPESVTSIGARAFECCTSLTSVTIPEGLTQLSPGCFTDCPKITEIIIPESVKTIGDYCFKYCHLTAVKFGSNIEHIGAEAFSTLSQFEINDKLKSLGDRALGDNLRLLKVNTATPPQLKSVNMGYTEDEAYNILVIVPAAGDDVYKNDAKWQGFHIVETAPTKTVYMTGKYPLSEEIATTTQQMPGNVTSLAIVGPLADDDWNIIKRNLISCYDLDLSGVTNTAIPAEVFRDNKHILSIKLPDGLKSIGKSTFQGCSNLIISELPASLESIDDYAFADCTMFDVDALPASLKTIGGGAFWGCKRLQITELPAVEKIGDYAFWECPRLMDLDMSRARFISFGAGVFRDCGKLRNVVLPSTLTSIGCEAFANTAVNFIEFPQGLEMIGESAFANTPIISVDLPRSIASISDGTFSQCPKIKSVSLSSKIQSIGQGSFLDCRGIKSISVPCAVPPTVGENAFQNVRYRDVTVSIPTMNYRDYLNALGWGAFTQLANSIFLDYQEVDENGNALPDDEASKDGVDAGAAENDAYDEIVKNITDEEEQAAEDAARDEAMFGDGQTDPAEIQARVQCARAAARAEAAATADSKARKAFSRLYSGQSMTIGDNKGYRVKIEPKEGVEIVKIEFGGKDITNTYIDGMVTLPALYAKSSLKVYRKGTPVGIGQIGAQERPATADVYNLQGIPVLKDATESQVRELPAGLYIYKGRKIAIR